MIDTLFTRTRHEQMAPEWQPANDMLQKLTGDAAFVEVFAQAPGLLDFVMRQFYAKVFFGGQVEQRYKQLARLKLSLVHGCRKAQILELGTAMAVISGMAKLSFVLDLVERESYCPFTTAAA